MKIRVIREHRGARSSSQAEKDPLKVLKWLFITALLYKWPKKTLQGMVIVLSVVTFFVLLSLYNAKDDIEHWQGELDKVVVTASYDVANCTGGKPLRVFLENRSSRAVEAINWEVHVYVPGHSTKVV